MANLSKASNIVQEKYVLYDVTSFTQKWHPIPVATNCTSTTQFLRARYDKTQFGLSWRSQFVNGSLGNKRSVACKEH